MNGMHLLTELAPIPFPPLPHPHHVQEELRELEDALQQELIDIRNGPNITKEIEIVKRQQK